MKHCIQCKNSFADSLQVCPNDGSTLTDFDINSIVGQTIDGKYEVQSLLGLGGMGAVFRARHIFINNDVAIKLIHPSLAMNENVAERFLREARAAAMIDHPNAIKVTDFGRAGDMLYLVMEFIQGYSLSSLIRKKGYLSPAVTSNIMTQVCAALDAAHSHQIIHRDLKPDNIMLKQNDLGQLVVKVLDFGIAKMKMAGDNSGSITRAGTIIGTLNYMSPEQCRGDEVLDLRSDIYSLGVVAFEMLTGRLPFTASTPTAVAVKHIVEQPPTLTSLMADIPEKVERVVMRTLSKDPDARYRRAGEFAADLANAVRSSGATQLLTAPGLFDDEPAKGATRPLSGETEDIPTVAAPVLSASPTGDYGRAKTDQVERMTMSTATHERGSQTGEQVVETGEHEIKTGEQAAPIPAPPRRAPLYAGLAVAILVLVVGGGYFAFRSVNAKGPAPPGSQKTDPALLGMVLIKGGWLKMGSPPGEGYEYEQPLHEVWVDPFYMDETEVTNEQFQKFVNATGYLTDAEKASDPVDWRTYATSARQNHPVVSVSWKDAAAYAKSVGKRLPTEAEWEYAARGGLVGKKYPWGDDSPQERANFGKADQAQGSEPSDIPTKPAKSFEPNGYGLYNMVGNVSEWCADWYAPDYYSKSPDRNPQGPSTGQSRVIRGGSWYSDFSQIRIAGRISESPGGYQYDRGFRCAKSK